MRDNEAIFLTFNDEFLQVLEDTELSNAWHEDINKI